jgi:hypothetical protein
MFELRRTLIPALLVGVLATVLLLWGPAACRSYFTSKTEVRVTKGQAEAGLEAGEIAVDTVGKNKADSDAVDQAVKEAMDELENAPDGNSNDAALRAACKLRSYQRDQRCAELRKADSAKLEAGNPAR